ncbi:MAG: hypothetical protein ACI8SR_001357 [Oceanicoccus sp.]
MIQQARTCIKSALFYIRFINGILFKDYQMLRLFTIITLFLLAACNPFNSDDDSTITLEGTDQNGTSITFVSENGYHAVKVNSRNWAKITDQITLSKLSENDTIEFIELCVPDEGFPNGKGVSFKFKTGNIPKYGISEDNNIYSCDTSHLTSKNNTPKSATIYSEQSNDGINIFNGTMTYAYINFDSPEPKLNGFSSKVENSILLIGKDNRDDSYYVYRNDKFTYEDKETISIDFYSENSMKVDSIDQFTGGFFEYSRTYSDDNDWLWLNLSYENNSIHLTIPDKFRRPQDTYNEIWSNYSWTSGVYARYTVSSRDIKKENLLEYIWQTIEAITVDKSGNQYGSIQLPDDELFTRNSLTKNTFLYYKDNIIIQHIDFTINGKRQINNEIIELSSLPNIPEYFNLSIESLNSTNLMLNIFNNHKNDITERLELQRYFEINQNN